MRKENLTVTAVATIAAALLILVVLVGSQAQAPLQLQRTATIEHEGIQLRVETDKEVYSTGEVVHVKIFEKNLRAEPVLPLSTFDCDILDTNGQMVSGRLSSLGLTDPNITIKPMEEFSVGGFSWPQLNNNVQQVPPGTYIFKFYLIESTVELRILVEG